jgi:lipopolysaccharide/colanic/teichoic acid biosynthesis glycosyltransferase
MNIIVYATIITNNRLHSPNDEGFFLYPKQISSHNCHEIVNYHSMIYFGTMQLSMSTGLFPKNVPVCKRIFDLLLTIPGLIIISPILGILALIVWLVEGSPVLFLQKRPGLHGEIFTVYKFRTMGNQTDTKGRHLPDDQRLTTFGRFLRSTSLDELPGTPA